MAKPIMSHWMRVRRVMDRVDYPKGGFIFTLRNNLLFMQHFQQVRCINKGTEEAQNGRKFYISEYSTDEEILRTAFLAVKLFEEHEINETFHVDGERFLNPHPEGGRL